MKLLPIQRKGIVFVIALFFCFLTVLPHFTPIFAEGAQFGAGPTPGVAQWVFDPEVTEVGKNADRARQLLWWVFSHPGISTAPVLVEMWSVSRNIVFIFVILVIVAFGFSFILLRRRATTINIPPILIRIGGILLYVTFSYLIVLALIQISEITMRFFIENVGGSDLFNVIFSGAGNSEQNYISFVGYRDSNPINQEAVHSSLLLIRLTSFTYFAMSLIILLRTVILWFMMVIAPFLALLLPFVFIRNIGIIWIGVFLQWLFYGPLLALFLATVTKIWVSGIPFSFDFSRAGQSSGQVYKTAINILYGGPAQTLSAGNSANYVDTYAEYAITLVMLWTAIILPWFLVRIFRDYCCDAIKASNATMTGIFDRIRQYPMPPSTSPVSPATTSGMAVELPFRQKMGATISELHKSRIEDITEINRVNTTEIARVMDLSVNSLSDISRLELNDNKRSSVEQQLNKLHTPSTISSTAEREKYASVRSELLTRAAAGDRVAQTMLSAGTKDRDVLVTQVSVMMDGRPAVAVQSHAGIYAPAVNVSVQPTMAVSARGGQTTLTSVETARGKKLPSTIPYMPVAMGGKQVATQVSVEDYEEVKKMWLKHYREAPVPETETIKTRNQWLKQEEVRLTNITNLLASSDPKLKQQGLEEVAEILPFMLLGGFTDAEILTYVKAKLEATKQIQTELDVAEKVKKETEKQVKQEEEETLLTPETKKRVEEKTKTMESSELKMPSEENKTK